MTFVLASQYLYRNELKQGEGNVESYGKVSEEAILQNHHLNWKKINRNHEENAEFSIDVCFLEIC